MTELFTDTAAWRSAVLSDDEVFRYRLFRAWRMEQDSKMVGWIMLNPSTADANIDDPTVRKCMAFSNQWGFDAMVVCNLFALRATDPGQLWTHPDPFGPKNIEHINNLLCPAFRPDEVIFAWGAWGTHPKAAQHVQTLIEMVDVFGCRNQIRCLGKTMHGQPRHPLYLSYAQPREPF